MDIDQVTYFSPLPEGECRSLLSSVEYGRVAWNDDQGVTVVPVNFQVVDGHVVFHTAAGTGLAKLADGVQVAFQVDDIDSESAIGWSVLVRGTTRRAPEDARSQSWMDDRTLGIMIEESSLTGRVISGTKGEEE